MNNDKDKNIDQNQTDLNNNNGSNLELVKELQNIQQENNSDNGPITPINHLNLNKHN